MTAQKLKQISVFSFYTVELITLKSLSLMFLYAPQLLTTAYYFNQPNTPPSSKHLFALNATLQPPGGQRLTFRFRNFSVLRLLPIFLGQNPFWRIWPQFRFRKIWSRKKSLGFGLGEFGLRKKVSVSVSENLVSEKSFGFGKFGLEKKVSVLVSENLISERKKAK